MAPVKRPYDVVSIPSDSGEDDTGQLARPRKMARQNDFQWGPAFDIDDYMAQGALRNGSIKNEPGLIYDIDEYIAQTELHTDSVENEDSESYDDEWIVEGQRQQERLRASFNWEDAVNQAAPGVSAPAPPTVDQHDDLGFDMPFQYLPFTYEEGLNPQDDPIIISDAAPSPERSSPAPERSPLDQILDVVPDVSHDHATQLLETHHGNIEQTLDVLLEGKYPKESDRRAAEKAAREAAVQEQKAAEDAEKEKLLNPQCTFSRRMKDAIIELLKDEFNTIPVKYIKEIQKDKKHLYATYLALNEAKHAEPCPFGSTPWRSNKDPNFDHLQATKHAKANIPLLKEQFESAKKDAIEWNSQRRRTITQNNRALAEAAAKAKEDETALETAKATGTAVECAACYDEYAPNKVIRCGSAGEHPVCFNCMKTYLGSEVGQSSHRLACPGGCGDTFREPQLRLVPDTDALTDRLMRLRQENDLRIAGIDDVEGCPFCDFKTVCLPIDVDFEFHCQSLTCNITSCRKCKEKSHIPDSCEEHQRKRDKNSALSHRHKIEEARSKALIRNCNKCKQPFIKSDGCNKMTCSGCGNLQCYLCGVDVTANYSHFNLPNSKCPVYSQNISLEDQHAQEVKAAAEAAEAEVLLEHPEIEKEDLDIIFADEAEKSAKRKRDAEMVFRAGDVARRRRRRHQAQGPAPANNPAPPIPAVVPPPVNNLVPPLPAVAGGYRAAYDPIVAVRAARDRLAGIRPFNLFAQRPNPPDAALGQFDFGFNDHLDAPLDPYQVAANQPAAARIPLDPYQVPANQPGWMANYEGYGDNRNRRQASVRPPNNPVQQPPARIVPFVPLPAPIPVQAHGVRDYFLGPHLHVPRWGDGDPW